MKDDLEKTQRLLEAATAAGEEPAGELDPETASLREAWLAFGQLLEVAQPQSDNFPVLLGEGQGVRAVPRPSRQHRWLLPVGGLLAASLLIGVSTTWMLTETDRSRNPSPAQEQTAAIKASDSTLVHKDHPTVSAADELQWDDALDEQVNQVSRQMLYAQQRPGDTFTQLQYKIEQFQQDLEENSL